MAGGRKTVSVSVRLTVDQWLTLRKRAHKARMPLSRYLLVGRLPPDLADSSSHKYWRKPAS